MKQLSLRDISKKIAKKYGTEESSIKNSVSSTSAHPDGLPPLSSVSNLSPLSPSVPDLSPPSRSPSIPGISLTLQDDDENSDSPPPQDM